MPEKINLKKVIKILKKTPYFLAENDFLSILLFIFLAFFIGLLVFYKYDILPQKKEVQKLEKPLFLDEKKFQKVLEEMEIRKKKFDQASFKEYPNPFEKLTK